MAYEWKSLTATEIINQTKPNPQYKMRVRDNENSSYKWVSEWFLVLHGFNPRSVTGPTAIKSAQINVAQNMQLMVKNLPFLLKINIYSCKE